MFTLLPQTSEMFEQPEIDEPDMSLFLNLKWASIVSPQLMLLASRVISGAGRTFADLVAG